MRGQLTPSRALSKAKFDSMIVCCCASLGVTIGQMGMTRLSDLNTGLVSPFLRCMQRRDHEAPRIPLSRRVAHKKIVVWLAGQGLNCDRQSAHTCGERAAPWPVPAQGTTIPTIRRYIIKYKLQTKFKRPRQKNCPVSFDFTSLFQQVQSSPFPLYLYL